LGTAALDAGNGSARGADSQFVCEVDGGSHGPRAFCAKPNRPGSTVQRNSSEYFGDWIYSGQGRIVGAPFDNVEGRKGYSGLYQFGASYNPGKFTSPTSATPRSGNYLLYWMASQALWRVDPKEGKGLDGTFAYDWSPPDINRNNTLLTAGLRFNEPLPLKIHNTMSLGYVRNNLSPQFLPLGMPAFKTEQGVEFNTLLDPLPVLLLQPVVQYYANVGGGAQPAVVFGFRTKVEF
jgi:carbohydrate-selective porin OprB